MAQARVAAVIDGQKRMLKGSVDSMQTLVAATRTAFGLGGGATFEFTWLDDDEDPIQISTDAELADAMEIAGKARDSWPRSKGALLVVHVRASGDLSVVAEPQGECEVDDFVVLSLADIPKHCELEQPREIAPLPAVDTAGEDRHADEQQQRARAEQETISLAAARSASVEAAEQARALAQVSQLERDQELARQLEMELEAQDEAALAEQERIAREIQDKLEQDEAADMAAIRAAQAKDGMPTPAPAPATAIAPAAASSAAVENAAGKRLSEATQKRLSLDPDTWNLVLQLSDMGFGEDYEKIYNALVKHQMDLSRAAEALLAQA